MKKKKRDMEAFNKVLDKVKSNQTEMVKKLDKGQNRHHQPCSCFTSGKTWSLNLRRRRWKVSQDADESPSASKTENSGLVEKVWKKFKLLKLQQQERSMKKQRER